MIDRLSERDVFYLLGACVGVFGVKAIALFNWHFRGEPPTAAVDLGLALTAAAVFAVLLVLWRRREEGSPQ